MVEQVRVLKPDGLARRILSLSSSRAGVNYYVLRTALDIPHSILSQRLKRLEENGFLRKEEDIYQITKKGTEELKKPLRTPSKALPFSINMISQNNVQKRHFQALYYPLKDPIPQQDLRLILQQAGIAYKSDGIGQMHFTFGITAELHSKYLMLYSPELYAQAGTSSHEVEAQAKRLLDEKALELEEKLNKLYNFKLKRIDRNTLISFFSKEEIAHEAHPITEGLEENKRVLAKHPIDKKQRLIIDASKKQDGFKELEPVHKLSAGEDSDTVEHEFSNVEASNKDWNDLLDGRIRLRTINEARDITIQNAENINGLTQLAHAIIENQQKLDSSVGTFVKEMKVHRQAYRDVASAARSMKRMANAMHRTRTQELAEEQIRKQTILR